MKYHTKKTLSYYWKSIRNYKGSFFLLVMAIFFGSILDSVVPIYLKNFFNVLTSQEPKEVVYANLLLVLMVIGILLFGKWLFWRIGFFTLNFLESKVMSDLSKECFSYLHKHSFAYFSNNFTGSLVKKAKSFVSSFEILADQFFYQLLPSAIKILIITMVLGWVNIFLGLGMLFWIGIFLLINWWFTKYKLKYDIKRSEVETNTSSFLADTVTNNINLKLFNSEEKECKDYNNLAEQLHKIRRFTWDLSAKFYGLQSFLLVILEVGILYFAINLWQRNVLTVGDFVLIQSYVITVMGMVWDFGRVISRIYERLAEAEEMTVILDTPYEVVDVENATDLAVNKGKIEFDGVSFIYDGKKNNTVDNFNLKINSSETVALVGISGTGKTTLIKLLLRLYDIQKGRILIDGQDISKVTQKSLRENVSLVPQDPILFHRSLMENIRYGRLGATDEEVVEAAKVAHCDKFINRLPLGYDTLVGERGMKLSGGEKQRVAIARAILRNAPILILDEATSSLDSESERFIQDSLDKLMKNKTVVVIAHRLSTIKKANRIVVINNRKIVEDGTHEELIKNKEGIYSKLWNIQICGFIK